jgi:hypothetical protein
MIFKYPAIIHNHLSDNFLKIKKANYCESNVLGLKEEPQTLIKFKNTFRVRNALIWYKCGKIKSIEYYSVINQAIPF